MPAARIYTDPDTDLLSVLEDVDAVLHYRHPRTDLDIGITALAGRLTGHRLAATTNPEDRAWLLYELGCRYTNAGLLHGRGSTAARSAATCSAESAPV